MEKTHFSLLKKSGFYPKSVTKNDGNECLTHDVSLHIYILPLIHVFFFPFQTSVFFRKKKNQLHFFFFKQISQNFGN